MLTPDKKEEIDPQIIEIEDVDLILEEDEEDEVLLLDEEPIDEEEDDIYNPNVYRITCTSCFGEGCSRCNETGKIPGDRFGDLDIEDNLNE